MKHFYHLNILNSVLIRPIITLIIISFITLPTTAQTITLFPTADAYVRNGNYSNDNYGSESIFIVKGSPNSGFTRYAYLKFSLGSIVNVKSAKLRIYGNNYVNSAAINISAYGVSNDSWTETGITFNNAPVSGTSPLSSVIVNNTIAYYELDVSDFIKSQLAGDKIVTLVLKDDTNTDKQLYFNSRENANNKPELFIDTTVSSSPVLHLNPVADAYVRNGNYSNDNFGSESIFIVKGSPNSGFTRYAYLKFSLGSIANIKSARLRIYGNNHDNSAAISISVYSVSNDSWTETGITFNNAPVTGVSSLSSVVVNNVPDYYELDVSDFVKGQLAGDKIVTLALKDDTNTDKQLYFNSKENGNNKPELMIDTTTAALLDIAPVADAFVRDGNYVNNNYGGDASLIVKGSPNGGFTRYSFLKFSLQSISDVTSARLRIYGSNVANSSAINVSVFGVADDSWTETGITFNNAPASATGVLSSGDVTNVAGYYDFDVTNFVKSNVFGDKVVSLVLKDAGNIDKMLEFNSKENSQNKPSLIVDTTTGGTPPPPVASNAMLFVENPDKFPSNDHFVFGRIQIPWTRDSVYNSNHDSLRVKIRNNGLNPLVVSDLTISNTALWKIDKINGANYNPSTQLPTSVSPGGSLDLMVKFIAQNAGTRAKVLHETLTVTSNDDKYPVKEIYLDGLWQNSGEGSHEPYSQEIITTFGFKTSTGYGGSDPDHGDSTKLKGNEVRPSYFVRSDMTRPVTIRQLAAYHNCCHSVETFRWFYKGTTTNTSVFSQIGLDGQSLLPRRSTSVNNFPAGGTITPTGAFGINIGGNTTDASINPLKKIGVRVYLALDSAGYIIPDAYILANDYLGTSGTNYDYNDNMYYIDNVKPYLGTAHNSPLNITASALDFGERVISQNISQQLNISNGGKAYSNGTQDPPITITSFTITGENKSEFSASFPAQATLNPQQATTMQVTFNPATQGLKIADLLIYYSNSPTPKRVPLYGIAKDAGTTVMAHYRINSGASAPVIINGKTWAADNQYSFDNLEPYTNPALLDIAGTDEDVLYLREQSSNGEKKPFRYQFPVANGTYYVRLHFAEVYWGAPGSGYTSGPGSRVFHVKMENQYALINSDLVREVGTATALIKNFPVTVTDNMLNIDFSATVNRPSVSAIEVYSFSAPGTIARSMANDSSANIAIKSSNDPVNRAGFAKPKVYPNPLHGQFTLEIPGNYTGDYKIEITDLSGRVYYISQAAIKPGSTSALVDISGRNFSPGVYLLNILSAGKITDVLKLIIK